MGGEDEPRGAGGPARPANAQDNEHATWEPYRIRYWPGYVLIDRKGFTWYEGYGEFHLPERHGELGERRIQTLLAE